MRLERWTSSSGRRRWLTSLDPREARAYAAAVRLALPHLELGPRSFGAPTGPGRSWRTARLAWQRTVATESSGAGLVIVSDVAACYPSMRPAAIRMAARRAGGEPEPLLAQLARFREAGVRGIPIGPEPSAWLAEAILSIADERARRAGIPPIRWVDDVVFAGDRDAVRRACVAWARALHEVGLRENESKRRTCVPGTSEGIAAIGAPSLAGCICRGIIRTS
jgi:hypothetical protein